MGLGWVRVCLVRGLRRLVMLDRRMRLGPRTLPGLARLLNPLRGPV